MNPATQNTYNSLLDVGSVLNTLQYFDEPIIKRFFDKSSNKFRMLALDFFEMRSDYDDEAAFDQAIDTIIKQLASVELSEEN